jgi:hypothetical protein
MQIEAEDEESFDSKDIDVSHTSAICLSKLALILQDKIVTPITSFSIEKLKDLNATWKDKYCALIALAAVLKNYENHDNICTAL